MSISKNDNNIKIWSINNWECIQNITKINNNGWLASACFLKDNNNNINIITTNLNNYVKSEYIKVFDLSGKKNKRNK